MQSDMNDPQPFGDPARTPQAPTTINPNGAQPLPPPPPQPYTGLPSPVVDAPSQPVQFKPHNPRRRLKLFLIFLLALLLVGGGSAAAYFTVILPNTPENKVLTALVNLAQQTQTTTSGTIDYTDKKASGNDPKGYAITYSLASDRAKNVYGLSGSFGVRGAQFPFELRYLEKNIYGKVGGLNSLNVLLPTESDALAKAVKGVNDQWYVVDRSFLEDANASCVTDVSLVLTDQDLQKVQQSYKKYPLFTVKSTAPATIDGVVTTKMDLDPASDEVAHKFFTDMESLSVAQKIKQCLKKSGTDSTIDKELDSKTKDITNGSTGTILAYITADKQLKQLEISSNEADSDVKIILKFDHKPVTIAKPENAKPIQDFLSDLRAGFQSVRTGVDNPITDVQGMSDFSRLLRQ